MKATTSYITPEANLINDLQWYIATLPLSRNVGNVMVQITLRLMMIGRL